MYKYLSTLSILLISCAVEETEVAQPMPEPEEEVNEETEAVVDVDPCLPQEDADGVRVEGQIAYPDGTFGDQTNTRIHMCSGSCLNAKWGEDGFCYPEGTLSPGTYALKIISFGKEGHATPLSFVTVGEDDIIFDEPILVPEFSAEDDLIDGVFDAGNGLKIDVEVDGFQAYLPNEEYVAAVPVDPMTSGLPLDGLDPERIVGMWYLGAFDAVVSPKWSFQVEGLGLPEGTTLRVLNGSYSEKKWVDDGTAIVDSNGVLHSGDDSGLSILSTLILLEE